MKIKIWPWTKFDRYEDQIAQLRFALEFEQADHEYTKQDLQDHKDAAVKHTGDMRRITTILVMKSGLTFALLLFCLSGFGQPVLRQSFSTNPIPESVAHTWTAPNTNNSLETFGNTFQTVFSFPQLGKNLFFDSRPNWTYGTSSGHGVGYNIYCGITGGSSDGELLIAPTNGSQFATGFVPFTNIPPKMVDSVIVGQYIGSALAFAPTNWTVRDSSIIGNSCASGAYNLDSSFLAGWGALGGFGGPFPTNIVRSVAIGASIEPTGNGVDGFSVVDSFFLGSLSGNVAGSASATGNFTNNIFIGASSGGGNTTANNVLFIGANQGLWSGASNAFNIFGTLFGTNCYTVGTYANPGKSGQLGISKYPSDSFYTLDVAGVANFDSGIASLGTNIYAISTGGYTNVSKKTLRVFGFTGTSVTFSNSVSKTAFSLGTITTGTTFTLNPKESLTGTSCAASGSQLLDF